MLADDKDVFSDLPRHHCQQTDECGLKYRGTLSTQPPALNRADRQFWIAGMGSGQYLFLQNPLVVIDPSNEQPLLCLVHLCNSGPPQMLHELGERDPSRGVQVLVVVVLNELLVHGIGLDALCTEPIGRVRYIGSGGGWGARTSVKGAG